MSRAIFATSLTGGCLRFITQPTSCHTVSQPCHNHHGGVTESSLEVPRSSSDILFYSATSDKLEAAEILKRFNHIIIKPSKHGE